MDKKLIIIEDDLPFRNRLAYSMEKKGFSVEVFSKIAEAKQSLKEKNEPLINYSDEIMYGLGNIIQNAIEHAKSKIDVNISWDINNIFVVIKDDGKGFPSEILERIGSPYISNKNNENNMGLGIFIAKNLIENIGGNIKFYNEFNNHKTIVEISLKRNI